MNNAQRNLIREQYVYKQKRRLNVAVVCSLLLIIFAAIYYYFNYMCSTRADRYIYKTCLFSCCNCDE